MIREIDIPNIIKDYNESNIYTAGQICFSRRLFVRAHARVRNIKCSSYSLHY
ncbi:protein of unknown function [Xenorhabdus poinarii G6]|uniref:Uncharacterized protein n=1 Tax=Xenorhabdus poinarii G6 TaxID=1354304 RepID=A0A068R396_9GAMM|nr:protein of unknown function [Xenorhabdus poinarii G6]